MTVKLRHLNNLDFDTVTLETPTRPRPVCVNPMVLFHYLQPDSGRPNLVVIGSSEDSGSTCGLKSGCFNFTNQLKITCTRLCKIIPLKSVCLRWRRDNKMNPFFVRRKQSCVPSRLEVLQMTM